MKITPEEKEINDLLNACSDQENEGGSKYPGMTYEQGISAAINWILGHESINPLE